MRQNLTSKNILFDTKKVSKKSRENNIKQILTTIYQEVFIDNNYRRPVRLSWVDFDPGPLEDIKAGKWNEAITVYFNYQEGELLDFLSTLGLYYLITSKKDFRITDFLFKEIDKLIPLRIYRVKTIDEIKIQGDNINNQLSLKLSVPSKIYCDRELKEAAHKFKGKYKVFLKEKKRQNLLYKKLSFNSMEFFQTIFDKIALKYPKEFCEESGSMKSIICPIQKKIENQIQMSKDSIRTSLQSLLPGSKIQESDIKGVLSAVLRTLLFGVETPYEGQYFSYWALPSFKYGGKEVGFGGLMCFLTSNDDIRKYEKKIIEILPLLYSKWSIYKWGLKTSTEIITHSTKAAVAAIMARNMSHNIGSHVLQHLAKEDNFYKYLQGRMDFIAEIATYEPSWEMSMDFVEELFEPFIAGYGEEVTEDGLKNPKIAQARLLSNIVKDEGIEDPSKIKIVLQNGTNKKEYFWKASKYMANSEALPKISVGISHANIGCHAFYSIVENFLRNSAKHNREKLKNGIEIRIKIEDVNDEYYKIALSDNLKGYTSEVSKKIERLIYEPIVDDKGAITPGGWGIKEMKICCGWLRGISAEQLPRDKKTDLKPKILSVNTPSVSISNNNIEYYFYIHKPKDVLFVTNKEEVKENPNEGIYKLNINQFKEALERKDFSGFRHKFTVFDLTGNDINLIKENKLRFPCRYFILSEDFQDSPGGITEITKYKNKELLMSILYEKWLCKLSGFENFSKLPLIRFNKKYFDPECKKIKCYSNCNKKLEDMIFFDHDDRKNPEKKCLYWEPYSGGLGTLGRKISGLNLNNDVESMEYIYELYEAALTKIIIADERLWGKRNDDMKLSTETYEKKFGDMWSKMGVKIITIKKERNDKLYVYGMDKKKEINEYINDLKNYSFFLIHKAIIGDVIGEEAFVKIKEVVEKKIPYIVVHTGRGAKEVPEGTKHLEYSNLERFICSKPDKHLFVVNLLMNLKKGE